MFSRFRKSSRQQRYRLTIALEDEMMKPKPPNRMVPQKLQIVEQSTVSATREKFPPLGFISAERLRPDDRRSFHIHLATVRQCAFTSPTVAVCKSFRRTDSS